MEKIKISKIISEEYPEGEIYSWVIPSINSKYKGIVSTNIIPFFRELGFSEEEQNNLDLDLENDKIYPPGTHLFFYGNKKIKAHIIVQEDGFLLIVLDSKLNKEKINKIIEKYFIFP